MSKSINVLIVDDSLAMRKIVSMIIQGSEFHEVGQAEHGREAVEKVQELSPDLVIMDVVMPEMDGIEALEKIRAIKPETIVVMASSIGTEDTVQRALELGAKNFVQKPYTPDGVLAVLRKVVEEQSA